VILLVGSVLLSIGVHHNAAITVVDSEKQQRMVGSFPAQCCSEAAWLESLLSFSHYFEFAERFYLHFGSNLYKNTVHKTKGDDHDQAYSAATGNSRIHP
jgi:hypothetical protein